VTNRQFSWLVYMAAVQKSSSEADMPLCPDQFSSLSFSIASSRRHRLLFNAGTWLVAQLVEESAEWWSTTASRFSMAVFNPILVAPSSVCNVSIPGIQFRGR
jgi:hypothetical protein